MINKNSYMIFLILLVLSFVMTDNLASCECKCVKGKPIPKCENAAKIKPVCSPRICGDIEFKKFDKIYAPLINNENKLLERRHKNAFKKNHK